MRLHTGVHGHRKRVCTESWLWEKNPLPHRGIEPASATFRSDFLPTELHPHPKSKSSLRRCEFREDEVNSRSRVMTELSVWRRFNIWKNEVKRSCVPDRERFGVFVVVSLMLWMWGLSITVNSLCFLMLVKLDLFVHQVPTHEVVNLPVCLLSAFRDSYSWTHTTESIQQSCTAW